MTEPEEDYIQVKALLIGAISGAILALFVPDKNFKRVAPFIGAALAQNIMRIKKSN